MSQITPRVFKPRMRQTRHWSLGLLWVCEGLGEVCAYPDMRAAYECWRKRVGRALARPNLAAVVASRRFSDYIPDSEGGAA